MRQVGTNLSCAESGGVWQLNYSQGRRSRQRIGHSPLTGPLLATAAMAWAPMVVGRDTVLSEDVQSAGSTMWQRLGHPLEVSAASGRILAEELFDRVAAF
jgi:hypothetical protein